MPEHVVVNAETANGQCKRIYGTVQEIDEKKGTELLIEQTKEQLNIQQARLLAFVEHIPVVAAMLDCEMRYLSSLAENGNRNMPWLAKTLLDGAIMRCLKIRVSGGGIFISMHFPARVCKKGKNCTGRTGWEHGKYLSWEVWPRQTIHKVRRKMS